ncbi:MAG: hypothetical protein ACKOT0_04310 [bacterium]
MARPPGWPARLPEPEDPEFPAAALAWLLDQGPGEWRALPGLRDSPEALAFRARCEVRGRLEAARTTYAGLRRELGEELAPAEMDAALAAVEAEGAGLLALEREVGLVAAALRGRRWRPRL